MTTRNRRRQKWMHAEQRVGEECDIGAKNDERAVQQIDDVEHAPDQRESDRDGSVQSAQHQTVREYLKIDHAANCTLKRRLPVASSLRWKTAMSDRLRSVVSFRCEGDPRR